MVQKPPLRGNLKGTTGWLKVCFHVTESTQFTTNALYAAIITQLLYYNYGKKRTDNLMLGWKSESNSPLPSTENIYPINNKTLDIITPPVPIHPELLEKLINYFSLTILKQGKEIQLNETYDDKFIKDLPHLNCLFTSPDQPLQGTLSLDKSSLQLDNEAFARHSSNLFSRVTKELTTIEVMDVIVDLSNNSIIEQGVERYKSQILKYLLEKCQDVDILRKGFIFDKSNNQPSNNLSAFLMTNWWSRGKIWHKLQELQRDQNTPSPTMSISNVPG